MRGWVFSAVGAWVSVVAVFVLFFAASWAWPIRSTVYETRYENCRPGPDGPRCVEITTCTSERLWRWER
jgi:hypothetical protein